MICPYLVAVVSSEYFVDWIKHAFITKFNNIPVEVSIYICIHFITKMKEFKTVVASVLRGGVYVSCSCFRVWKEGP